MTRLTTILAAVLLCATAFASDHGDKVLDICR